MPSASSPASLHVANGLRLASGDLRDAKVLRQTGSRNAAYLAEQGVEKLVLALLTSENIHAPIHESHQLGILVDKLPMDHALLPRLRTLTFLTVYATTYQYPKTGGHLPAEPPWERIDGAITLAEALLAEACASFGVDVAAPDTIPAQRLNAMR